MRPPAPAPDFRASAAELLPGGAPPPPHSAQAGQRPGPGPWSACWAAAAWAGGLAQAQRRRSRARRANKLLKPGVDSASVYARFATERQALARLSRPHIARLLDAGLGPRRSPTSSPEHIAGPAHPPGLRGPAAGRASGRLPAAGRCRLPRAPPPAGAPRPKPGNVLVTPEGQVEAAGFRHRWRWTRWSPATPTRPRLGERPDPQLRQPRAAARRARHHGHRHLPLGVLLYQCSPAARPYGRDATDALADPGCAARGAVAPSTLDAPDGDAPCTGRAPACPAGGRPRQHPAQGLEKQPEHRYASVQDLPPTCAPTWPAARCWKARAATWPLPGVAPVGCRHHLGPWAWSPAAMLALVLGLGGTLWQMQLAREAQARAEHRFTQLRELSRQMVFGYHDQIANLPGSLATREACSRTHSEYMDGLATELGPELAGQPQLARELAESYSRIAALQGDGFAPSAGEPAGLARQPRQGPGPGALLPRQHRLRRAPRPRRLARVLPRCTRAVPSWPCAAASSPRPRPALDDARRLDAEALRPPRRTAAQAQPAPCSGGWAAVVGQPAAERRSSVTWNGVAGRACGRPWCCMASWLRASPAIEWTHPGTPGLQ